MRYSEGRSFISSRSDPQPVFFFSFDLFHFGLFCCVLFCFKRKKNFTLSVKEPDVGGCEWVFRSSINMYKCKFVEWSSQAVLTSALAKHRVTVSSGGNDSVMSLLLRAESSNTF